MGVWSGEWGLTSFFAAWFFLGFEFFGEFSLFEFGEAADLHAHIHLHAFVADLALDKVFEGVKGFFAFFGGIALKRGFLGLVFFGDGLNAAFFIPKIVGETLVKECAGIVGLGGEDLLGGVDGLFELVLFDEKECEQVVALLVGGLVLDGGKDSGFGL